jgi:hypothetical protein
LPYLSLFSLVSLVPKNLKEVKIAIFDEEVCSRLLEDHQNVIPSQIHDATTLPRSYVGSTGKYLLSPTNIFPHHYWRLPHNITPQAILANVLHHVAGCHQDHFDGHEEVKLAIELQGLLALHLTGRKGPSGGGGRDLTSQDGGGGILPSNSKRGRKKKHALTHSHQNNSTTASSFRPIMSTVSGRTLQARSQFSAEICYSGASQHFTSTAPPRTPIMAVNHDRHRFLSRRPIRHFHTVTQSSRVTPFFQTIRRLMRLG